MIFGSLWHPGSIWAFFWLNPWQVSKYIIKSIWLPDKNGSRAQVCKFWSSNQSYMICRMFALFPQKKHFMSISFNSSATFGQFTCFSWGKLQGCIGAKPAAAKPATAEADYSRPRQTIADQGRPWQTMVDQAPVIFAVLPASPMHFYYCIVIVKWCSIDQTSDWCMPCIAGISSTRQG